MRRVTGDKRKLDSYGSADTQPDHPAGRHRAALDASLQKPNIYSPLHVWLQACCVEASMFIE